MTTRLEREWTVEAVDEPRRGVRITTPDGEYVLSLAEAAVLMRLLAQAVDDALPGGW